MSLSPASAYLHLSHDNDDIAATCNDADFNDFLNNFLQESECGRRLPTLHDHGHGDVHAQAPLAASTSCFSAGAEDATPTNYKKPTSHENALPLKSMITAKKRKQQEVLEHGGGVGVDVDANISRTMRRVSPREDKGSWSPVVSPSTRKRDGNDDETYGNDDETAPTPTAAYTPDYTEKENNTVATLKFDDNIGMGSDENMFFDEDEEAMAHEKLYSTNTMNTKWDDNWQHKFGELQSFKQDNGHIDVSISNENTRSLGLWLDRQRIFVRHYEATFTTNELESYKRRYDLLLSIGLDGLGARDKAWEKRFGELLAYRSKHHTCNVPTKGGSLGRWVSKMRKQYKTYDLCKEVPNGWNDKMERRYLRLKEAGFVFCAAENEN